MQTPIFILIAVATLASLDAAEAPAGDEAAALATLTRALCNQDPAKDASTPEVTGRADGQSAVRLARAWANAWDVAGRPDVARTQVGQCLGQKPLGAAALAAAADLSGAWTAAEALCAEALGRHATAAADVMPPALRGELWRCRAAAVAHLGQELRGLTLLQQGLADVPEASELYVAVAQAQLALGAPHAAHAALAPLLALRSPPDPTVLRRARGIVDAARESAAPAFTPQEAAEQRDLAALMQTGSEDADDLAHVHDVATSSSQPRLWPACALILLRGANPALGRELLHKASRALPLDPDPSRLLAVYHLSATDYAGALEALLQAVARQPFDPESQVMLASVASRASRWDIAERAYTTLLQLEPDRESHRQGLASVHAQRAKAGQGGHP